MLFHVHSRNTPRKSREGNPLIFLKEELTIVSYGRFVHKTKEKLEKIGPMFSSCSHSHYDDSQPKTLNYRNPNSIFGSSVIRMSFGFSKLS